MKRYASALKILFMTLFFVCFTLLSQPVISATTDNTQKNAKHPVDSNIQNIVSRTQKDNLKNNIKHLEAYGERSSRRKQNEAVTWAKDRFKYLGLESWTETYEIKGQQWNNAFARIRGKSKPEDAILVIAHMDSISNDPKQDAPGADDNGSGISVLMEIARILKNTTPEKSILFGIFSNEEHGELGSKAFARKARLEKQNIQAVINLDILGYNPSKSTAQWKFLATEGSLKYKVKTLLKIMSNFSHGIINGGDMLIVAGRPESGHLVRAVGDSIRSVGGITVKEELESGCF